VYNKENLKFYFGAGAGYFYQVVQQNKMFRNYVENNTSNPEADVPDYLAFKKSGLNVMLRSGVVSKNNVELGIIYYNPNEMTNYISAKGSSVTLQNVMLSVNYIFAH
jgi:hypothetical protein